MLLLLLALLFMEVSAVDEYGLSGRRLSGCR